MLDIIDAHGLDGIDVDRQVEAINETHWDVCGRQPWPFLEQSIDLTWDGTGPIPANWPDDFGAAMVLIRDSDGRKLQPTRLDDFLENYGANLASIDSPYLYYFEANQLKVYPVPGNGVTALMKYIRVPAELTETSVSADVLLPARYHRSVLVNGAISKLSLMDDDIDISNAFERLMEKYIAQMTDDLWASQYDRPDFIHVNDPDNWDYS